MDKTQALARLTALESEALALRKIIEAPEPAKSLLTKPEPGSGKTYFAVTGNGISPLHTYAYTAIATSPSAYQQGSIFQTQTLAEAYAQAIETMLLLRHQPGTVPANSGTYVLRVVTHYGQPILIKPDTWNSTGFVASFISPCFDTEADAIAAINTVGEERILRMFKTFHHIS